MIRSSMAARLAPATLILMCCSSAGAEGIRSLQSVIASTKPIADLRLRSEEVDQEGLPEQASAVTLRGRLGFETETSWRWSLLGEAELAWPLATNYNSTLNGKTEFPVVADPESREINRLQFTTTSIPGTTVILGRQRIIHDDHRFVGNSGWRQNEQTFDALRILNRSIRGLTLDLTYLDQVNRSFGRESPVGRYTGGSYLLHAAYEIPYGKLTGFAYLLDFEEAPGDSSNTLGMRWTGERSVSGVKLSGLASFAIQEDRGGNPVAYRDGYYSLELIGSAHGWSAGAGIEVLEGDGAKGFATPLATLHRFQGWADKFLQTPADGVDDRYVTLSHARKPFGVLDGWTVSASYHRLASQRLSTPLGSELDLQLSARRGRLTGTLKYADYRAERFASDTDKLWLQIEFVH